MDATNTNLRTSVDISKQDITNGKELPGAKLEIRDTDGNLVEGWTSTKTPHTVRGPELENEYTLTEKCAPDGYAEAESIVFKLVQEGNEQSNIVYVKSDDDWVKLDDATVIMQDAPVLDIDKTDIAGNLLPGATLTIRDADGEAIDTWVTDYKTHRVPISDDFLKLSDDSKKYIYTLVEDAAPAGFEIAEWQSYRNKANFPKMVAAACIINDGSSDDRFTDFRNWLIMQGYDAYRQALIDPDNLAALNIPFRNTEWMGCGNVAWYAYAGQQLRTYFEKAGITAELHRKYPAMLELPDDLNRAIMREQLAPHRAQETEWERQMLRTEVKHYIDTSGLAYSYNEFYTQNMPDKVAWKTLQSDLFSNLPQIKAERMPQDFSVVLPKLWRKRQAWDTERTKRPPYRGEER